MLNAHIFFILVNCGIYYDVLGTCDCVKTCINIASLLYINVCNVLFDPNWIIIYSWRPAKKI